MQHLRFLKLFFAAFLLLPTAGFSVTYYWIATTAQNWNATSGGNTYWATTATATTGGTVLPGVNDDVNFTVNKLGNCTLNVNVSVSGINITGYTGIITQNNTFTLTIGAGGFTQSSGTFRGGNSAIDVTGNFTVSGGDFRSTSNSLQVKGDYSYTGTAIFRHNNGQVVFRDNSNNSAITRTATGTPQNFYKVNFAAVSNNKSWAITTGNTLIVENELRLSGTRIKYITAGTLDVRGDMITEGGAQASGTTEVLLTGTANQTITGEPANDGGQHFPVIRINKTGGTATFLNNIALTGLTRTAGNVDFSAARVIFTQTGSFSLSGRFTGSNALSKLMLYPTQGGVTVTVNDTVTVTDTLHFFGSGPGSRTFSMVKAASGFMRLLGNVWCQNTAPGGSGTLIFSFEKAGNQTLQGSETGTVHNLGTIRVNKPSGTLFINDLVSVAGNWDRVNGTVNTGTSTIQIQGGNKSITGSTTFNNVRFIPTVTSATWTLAAGTVLTVNGNYEVTNPFSMVLNGGELKLRGNITIAHTGSLGTSTTLTTIEGSNGQEWVSTVSAGQGGLCNVNITKTGGKLNMIGVLNIRGSFANNAVLPAEIDGITNQATLVFLSTTTFNAVSPGGTPMLLYNLQFRNTANYAFGSNIGLANNLEIMSGATLNGQSYTATIGGDWINQNTTGGWTPGTSTIVFTGTGNHVISRTGGASQSFTNITFNRPESRTNLQCPVTVTGAMTLTAGKVISTATNLLSFPNNASCTGGGIGAFIYGPVRKTGDDAFVFLLGDTILGDSAGFHPLGISAPAAATDVFEAIYTAGQYGPTTLSPTLEDVDLTQYWSLNRIAGSSSPLITLNWNAAPITYITDFGDMVVTHWDGTQWINLGQSALTITSPTGSITATSFASWSGLTIQYFTVGHRPRTPNTSPVAVLSDQLDGGVYTTSGNRLRFRYDEEYGLTSTLKYKVFRVGNNQDISAIMVVSGANQPTSVYGTNFFNFELLDQNGNPLSAGLYVLEVINSKNERLYLRFKI